MGEPWSALMGMWKGSEPRGEGQRVMSQKPAFYVYVQLLYQGVKVHFNNIIQFGGKQSTQLYPCLGQLNLLA